MKFLYIITLSIFFISCQKQNVKIPINNNHGILEVWDNSRIYILFKKENNDTLAELKLGQTITTTHWLTAIDKRLKLKHIKKALEKILKKRHKKSIHSKEGMHTYFTFLDSTQKKVAFIDFDSIQLIPDYFTSTTYFSKYHKVDDKFHKIHLKIYPKKILLNDSINLSNFNKTQIKDTIQKIINIQTKENKNMIYLNFDHEIFFDQFLDMYTFFKNNSIDNLQLSTKIFIFTP